MAKEPKKVLIRAYNIGFGDCFLLSFVYGKDDEKHMLIDFGTTRRPDDAGSDYELQIAKDIEERTGGQLDVVVATHRHKDHISGFTTGDGKEQSGDVIRKIARDAVVILPWTEDPDAPIDATDVHHGSSRKKSFVQQLENMHAFAEAVVAEVTRMGDVDADTMDPAELAASGGPKQRFHNEDSDDEGGWFSERTLRRRLAFIGEDAIKNVSAVKNLLTMGKRREFVFFGADPDLGKVLPGVKVSVLGPPTIDQWPQVKKQNPKNQREYWHLQQQFWGRMALNAGGSADVAPKPLFPDAKTCEPQADCKHETKCGNIPRASEWFVRRLRGVRAKQLMQLVLAMDSAMNNTSVILLFEVGGKRLLFPGDAQWENWQFALEEAEDRDAILEELKKVDVYKVGHHGSLNATPKSLWELFEKRGETETKNRMMSLISTKKGVHAHSPETAVPRTTLVRALKSNTDYRSTESVKPSELYFEEEVS